MASGSFRLEPETRKAVHTEGARQVNYLCHITRPEGEKH